jgi:hypothetical protein
MTDGTYDRSILCVAPWQQALSLSSGSSSALQGASQIALSELHCFDRWLQNISSSNPGAHIHLIAGLDPRLQVRIAFLLGCHLIASQGRGFEETFLAFRPLHQTIDLLFGLAEFKNSLRSICCAKCLRWIDFDQSSDDEFTSIQMDEFAHYSRYI